MSSTTDLEKDQSEFEPVSGAKTRVARFSKVLLLSFSSLGAVYGDIGTSPMYVMNSIKIPNNEATKENIYGCCSIIFWLFVILVFFKYTLIVLQLGPNKGEGGQIAIYAKIARNLHFGPKDVQIPGASESSDLEVLHRSNTLMSGVSENSDPSLSNWRTNKTVVSIVSFLCLALAFLGCSLIISDGLLTPTTTVLSAVGGIQVAVPSFTALVGVSEAILIFLFALQYLGSTKLSIMFAPIMFTWLLCMAVSGVYNIAKYDPAVFRSLSPYYAIQLLRGTGIDCFGGGMLAITGTEAMFADVGHFGKLPIQIGISFTLICLILCYLGQGAYLVKNPNELSNVFYASIPGGINNGFYWFVFVLAILSTIVASQALILGVLSIVSQLITLDCFPKLRVIRFSAEHKGKVYIPVAIVLLLAGVCACTAGFQNSNNVTAAYGLGISLDFIVTSILMVIVMLFVYRINYVLIALYACIFMPLEMCLVIANCKKVPSGAWFPLMMCAIFMCFLAFWRYCRESTVTKQIQSRVRISQLFPELMGKLNCSNDEEYEPVCPTEVSMKENTPTYHLAMNTSPGVVIIFSESPARNNTSPNTFPGVYALIVRKFAILPSVAVFCSVKIAGVPVIPEEERILVVPSKVYGHYRALIRFGFTEQVEFNQRLQEALLQEIGEHSMQPLTYVFEKSRIRCATPATRNWFKFGMLYVRKVLIESIFTPLNALYDNDDHIVSANSSEYGSKMFMGTILEL